MPLNLHTVGCALIDTLDRTCKILTSKCEHRHKRPPDCQHCHRDVLVCKRCEAVFHHRIHDDCYTDGSPSLRRHHPGVTNRWANLMVIAVAAAEFERVWARLPLLRPRHVPTRQAAQSTGRRAQRLRQSAAPANEQGQCKRCAVLCCAALRAHQGD